VERAHHGRLDRHEIGRARRLADGRGHGGGHRRAPIRARRGRWERALPDDPDAGAAPLPLELGEVVLHRELHQLVHGGARRAPRRRLALALGARHRGYPAAATRPRYSPLRVSTFTTSPSLRKSGTCTTAPVSKVAGLLPPCAVSPRTPRSVR